MMSGRSNFFVACFFVLSPMLYGEQRIPESVDWKVVDIGALDLEPLKKLVSAGLTQQPLQPVDALRIADAHYYLGKYEMDKSIAESHFDAAIRLSDQVLIADSKNIPALLAWCASKGELAQMKNPFTALSYIGPIKEKFLLLKELAPSHENYVADRALGRLYQLAPSFISIGSTKKARFHLRAALDGAPDSPANQIYWADFLMTQGDIDEARRYARKALANPRLATSSLERFDWSRMANALLKKIDSEFK